MMIFPWERETRFVGSSKNGNNPRSKHKPKREKRRRSQIKQRPELKRAGWDPTKDGQQNKGQEMIKTTPHGEK